MEIILIVFGSIMYTMIACFCTVFYILEAEVMGFRPWFGVLCGIFWPLSLGFGIFGGIVIGIYDYYKDN